MGTIVVRLGSAICTVADVQGELPGRSERKGSGLFSRRDARCDLPARGLLWQYRRGRPGV